MGPETPISSSEDERDQYFRGDERKWCDICGRDVRIEGIADGTGEQRFRIKIYASNGLMRAGAWAAAWREMERVDVEIEPFVEGGLAVELEHMAASAVHVSQVEHDDGFEDEEEDIEHVHERSPEQQPEILTPEDNKMRRRLMEEERIREIYGPDTPFTPCPPARHTATQRNSSRSIEQADSLPDLLIAAFKVAMRDKKNVAICLLSVLVLMLALRPGSNLNSPSMSVHAIPEITTSAKQAVEDTVIPAVAEASVKVSKVMRESATENPVIEVETVKSQSIQKPIQEEPDHLDTLVDSPKQILPTPEVAEHVAGPNVDHASESIEQVEKEEEIPI
jgi:hypothetical protein